ncbi:TIGR04283 family arsenosugar biosynthesis glycosyltransferase [soil metagenome]
MAAGESDLDEKKLVSIIIPTLNEAAMIAATLESVAAQAGLIEVIISDGGSDDATIELAQAHAAKLRLDLRVVNSNRGRARQLNSGARAARGAVLWFLHADTRPPPEAATRIRKALLRPTVVGGCFRLRFDRDGLWYRVYEWRIWSRRLALAFGDRAQFARATTFRSVGGFPDQDLFEDLELARALARVGDFVFLDDVVTTSSRRFHRNGAVRQQLMNGLLWTGWVARIRPERLKQYYSDVTGERD